MSANIQLVDEAPPSLGALLITDQPMDVCLISGCCNDRGNKPHHEKHVPRFTKRRTLVDNEKCSLDISLETLFNNCNETSRHI